MNECSFFQQLNFWHQVISWKIDNFPVKDLGKDPLSLLVYLPWCPFVCASCKIRGALSTLPLFFLKYGYICESLAAVLFSLALSGMEYLFHSRIRIVLLTNKGRDGIKDLKCPEVGEIRFELDLGP